MCLVNTSLIVLNWRKYHKTLVPRKKQHHQYDFYLYNKRLFQYKSYRRRYVVQKEFRYKIKIFRKQKGPQYEHFYYLIFFVFIYIIFGWFSCPERKSNAFVAVMIVCLQRALLVSNIAEDNQGRWWPWIWPKNDL